MKAILYNLPRQMFSQNRLKQCAKLIMKCCRKTSTYRDTPNARRPNEMIFFPDPKKFFFPEASATESSSQWLENSSDSSSSKQSDDAAVDTVSTELRRRSFFTSAATTYPSSVRQHAP
jgi:hypothetical protein